MMNEINFYIYTCIFLLNILSVETLFKPFLCVFGSDILMALPL